MKKLFLTLIVAFFTITGGIAQNVTVEEPEFAEETLLLTSNNQGVKSLLRTPVLLLLHSAQCLL